jgi:starch-binding outer membrane protein SusE/F
MKKTYLLMSLVLGMTFLACEEERDLPTLSSTITPPVLATPASTTIKLTEATAANTALTLTWVAPDYGYDAPVSYSVLMDSKGNNFADAIEIATSYNDTAVVNVSKLNTTMLLLGGLDGIAKDVEIKVVASIKNTSIEDQVSNVIGLNVTPYEVVIIYPHLNLPGSYTTYDGSSWSGTGTEYSRIYSLKSDDRYEGYVYMVAGGSAANAVEFKFTKVNWGDGEYSYSGTSGKLIAGGGSNVPLASGGYYKIAADLNELTYSVTKITSWAIIGGATGDASWSTEIPLTYDQASNKWTLTTNLVAGEFKFRANSGWDINYGDDKADFKLDAGGANIVVAASGNYTITLDLVGPVYKYKLKKN